MPSSLRLVRNSTSALRNPHARVPCSMQIRLASAGSKTGSNWHGRETEEHAVNRKDELDVQAKASQSGGRERASGDERQSQASTEKDSGNQNEQAKKDHPEAPGPVIGMNDERGQVDSTTQVVGMFANCWTDGTQEVRLICDMSVEEIAKNISHTQWALTVWISELCRKASVMIGVVLYHWLHNAWITGGLNLIESTSVRQFDSNSSSLNFQASSGETLCDISSPSHGFVLIGRL